MNQLSEEEIKKIESELEFIPTYEEEKDIPTGDSVRMLGYGGPGSGKTEFVRTIGEDTCLVNIGKGLETIQNIGARRRNPGSKITVVDLNKILSRKDKKVPKDEEMVNAISDAVYHATRVKGFKKIAIDDMTEYRYYALLQGMKINFTQGKSQSYPQVEANHGLLTPVVQDFGTEMGIVEDFLRWFCNDAYERGYHIYVTAHTRAIYKKIRDSKGKIVMGEPSELVRQLPGFTGEKFPDTIPRLFSIVGFFNTNGTDKDGNYKIRLYLQGGKELCVKHRYSGTLPEYVDNPRFDKILEAIKSNQKLEKDGRLSKI